MGTRPPALPKGFQNVFEIRRQRRFEVDVLAATRMNKRQAKRVQHDARRGEPHQFLQAPVLTLAVSQITHQRKAEELEMNTDLMCTPGMQARLYPCRSPQSLKHLIGGPCLAPGIVPDRHAFTM